ncbi:hypothetical protein BEN47_06110 [Hymenobacter lapidarius]|uniref:Major capsid protein n=1 Tax=Hymenobacter lapidarius TaxID=1908237 RepID=A0A1G1SQE0_9BACT|nr:hypothetical protein [Hymenobacter lapidarius]OGX80828.1 hypothetical protein BEN47_06110 [Hymenobacter lapidarius]
MALSTLYITEVKADARGVYADPEALLSDPAHVITANAVQANQRTGTGATGIQGRLQASPTDFVDVQWGVDTGDVQDCTDDCALVGAEGEAATTRIDAPICKEITFQISEETMRRLGIQGGPESVQRAAQAELSRLLSVKAAKLDTWVNAQTLARAKVLHNAPKAGTAAGVGTVGADGVITVPTANYNRKLVAQLVKMARLNQMGSPYMIDGGQLFVDYFNARLDGANPEGGGDAARVAFFREYFDLEGFADAALAEDTFLVKPGALGLFYKSFLPSTPRETAKGQIWTNFKSNNITDMLYDVVFEEACVMVNGHPVTVHTGKLKAHIGVHKAAGVDAVRPGILLLKDG